MAAVVDAAVALQELPASDEWVVEAEINPLIVAGNGAVAVDAMVTVEGANGGR